MTRRRNRGRVIPLTNDRAIGSTREIARLMREDGAIARIGGIGRAPKTCHLYARPSVLHGDGTLATCAVVQVEPGVWRADGWTVCGDGPGTSNLIPVGDRQLRRYGQHTLGAGGFEGSFRMDLYTPTGGDACPRCRARIALGEVPCHEHRPILERCMARSHKDFSPRSWGWNGSGAPVAEQDAAYRAYDHGCSCCYLNIPHTIATHDAAIRKPGS